MDGSGEQLSLQTTAASDREIKLERTDGSYESFICNNSARPQLKQALAVTSGAGADGVLDDADLVLNCPMCTGEVYHAACGGADFRTLCSTCGQETAKQWTPLDLSHTPCEGSVASRQMAAAEAAGDELGDHVPASLGPSAIRAKSKFLPFKHALLYARSLKLKTLKEWEAWRKTSARPANMPSNPNQTYRHEGWQGYGHWLGTGNLVGGKQEYLPFKKALLYARSLKLKSMQEWEAWRKTSARPANIPSTPERTYKHEGWQGYGHWLGTGNVANKYHQFLPFTMALLHVRSLKLKSRAEWTAWCKIGTRPANVPSGPHNIYKHEGWQGWGHWLGTVKKDQPCLPFKKALLYARSLKLKTVKEWQAWSKSAARPAKMPSHPERLYKHDGWQGYGHWLGTGTVASNDQQFLPFKKALLYARSLKLKKQTEWQVWCTIGQRPANLPTNPRKTYKHDGWQGYGHWLGTGTVAPKDKHFLPKVLGVPTKTRLESSITIKSTPI